MDVRIRTDEVKSGRNIDKESDGFVRCARCGFLCKLDRDHTAPDGSRIGWGINLTEIDTYDASHTLYDPIVTTGCPQCGTLRYTK